MAVDASEEQELVVERAGGVVTLTLHRPRARNALTSSMIAALQAQMRWADEDDEVDVVVLTGSDPAFCAGMDLKELGSGGGNLELGASPDGVTPGAPWPRISKPVIGAVNGMAVTGGLEVALHCDLLVASERAAFADTHARLGLMPGWGMPVLLPRAVGRGLALQLSLTGDVLTAADALRAGLVIEVVPHAQLLDRARAIAQAITSSDRAAVRAVLATHQRICADEDAPGLRVEAAASRSWIDRGFDPGVVEQRREAVMGRSRGQGVTVAGSGPRTNG